MGSMRKGRPGGAALPRTRRVRGRREALHFYKVSGAGNHFVLLDVRKEEPAMRRPPLVRALCVKAHSVGADGVLFVEGSRDADFNLSYYNSDGGEAALCGNGARCAAVYAFEKGIAGCCMSVGTRCGTIRARIKEGVVELELEEARNLKQNVAVLTDNGRILGSFVETGVPHFVTIVADVNGVNVEVLGRQIRHHRLFQPEGVNVNFVQLLADGSASIRTYERGVEAETLACGTGAAAAAVYLVANRLVRAPVRLSTRGGDVLLVEFGNPSNPLQQLTLVGPARVVYEGDVAYALLRQVLRRRG
ncbi:MAG: diaminopimelate epimerase [Candidatus Eisenbacteria bacterium]